MVREVLSLEHLESLRAVSIALKSWGGVDANTYGSELELSNNPSFAKYKMLDHLEFLI